MAQSLRQGGTQMIGFVADAIATTPFAGAIIRGAQDAAWAQGYLLLIVNTDGNAGMQEEAVKVMLEHRVRAIVYSSWYHHSVSPPGSIREVPSILVDCFLEDSSLPSVVPDEAQGGRTATEVLLGAGHRRVAMLNSSVPAPATTWRPVGYRQALEAAGISPDERLFVEVEPVQEGGYGGASRLLDLPPGQRPTALFAYNDRVAMGVYAAASERGLRVPEDLAVVGFDNQEVISAHLRPPLSTIALPHYEMGWWGVNYLLSSIMRRRSAPPVQHRVACPYVERLSVTTAFEL
jgi:LacI family transcriptional regulator